MIKAFAIVALLALSVSAQGFLGEEQEIIEFSGKNFTMGVIVGMEKDPKATCSCEDDSTLAADAVDAIYTEINKLITEYNMDIQRFVSGVTQLWGLSSTFYANCRGDAFEEAVANLFSSSGLMALITRLSWNFMTIQKDIAKLTSGDEYEVGFGAGNILSIILDFHVDK